MVKRFGFVLSFCLLFTTLAGVLVLNTSAAGTGFDENGKYAIIDEKASLGGTLKGNENANWVKGYLGEGLKLNGIDQFIEVDPAPLASLSAMSFSTWVNWHGAVTPGAAPWDGFWDQTILCFATEGRFLYLSPVQYKDNGKEGDEKVVFLDGIHAEANNGAGSNPSLQKSPASDGYTGLAENVWQQLTLTMNGSRIVLYVNGVEFAAADCALKPSDICDVNGAWLNIGNAWFGPKLNATLDETALYNKAMTAAEVKALYDSQVARRPGFDANGKYSLVDESDSFFGELLYRDNAQDLTADMWVKGLSGRGLKLDGQGQNIAFDVTPLRDLDAMTFSTWVQWGGESDDMQKSAWWQRLMVVSGPKGLVSICPQGINYDEYKDEDGNVLDGLYAVAGTWGEGEVNVYKPVLPDSGGNRLASKGGWSQVSVTLDGQTFSLYLNGKLFASAPCPVKPSEMELDTGRLGWFGIWPNDSSFNGVYDETAFYNKAMTAAEIEALYTTQKAAYAAQNPNQPDPHYEATEVEGDGDDSSTPPTEGTSSTPGAGDTSGADDEGGSPSTGVPFSGLAAVLLALAAALAWYTRRRAVIR